MPPGGDAYLFKSVLHDWEDAEAGLELAGVTPADGDLRVFEAVRA